MGLENRPSSSSLRKNARRLQERERVSEPTEDLLEKPSKTPELTPLTKPLSEPTEDLVEKQR
jgi:hypothetical protein